MVTQMENSSERKFFAEFRFYEELNDFLPDEKFKKTFTYEFNGKPSIKDAIEAIGVPHTEVDLILVNQNSVEFDYHLCHGDQVAVYPKFESLDIFLLVRLRKQPLRESRFVLDVHLGKLARLLRLLGFDSLYRNNYADAEIVRISVAEKRIVLTRDQGLLKNKQVTHGYWLRSAIPEIQIREIVQRFDLSSQMKPFQRCPVCNGTICPIPNSEIATRVPPKSAGYYNEFFECQSCGKVYWKGSHYQNIRKKLDCFLKEKCL